jgi:hypothetical protein
MDIRQMKFGQVIEINYKAGHIHRINQFAFAGAPSYLKKFRA